MTDRQWPVGGSDAGVRLDRFLAARNRLGSRGRAAAALQRGKVFLNGAEAGPPEAALRLAAADVVRVWLDRPGSAKRRLGPATSGELRIVYGDDSLLVLDKPAGLLAVRLELRSGVPSLYEQVLEYLRPRGKQRPFVVHRIDRDTSGLVLFARDARAQRNLKEQFRRREPERVYRVVVYGHPDPAAGTWRDRLVWDRDALIQKRTTPGDPRGAEATSDYRVVESFDGASLLEVRLHTGRQNQIRIQARLHGHALVGERRYVPAEAPSRPIVFPRQALHAWRLAFRHPADGRLLRIEAPLPDDLADLIGRLRRR